MADPGAANQKTWVDFNRKLFWCLAEQDLARAILVILSGALFSSKIFEDFHFCSVEFIRALRDFATSKKWSLFYDSLMSIVSFELRQAQILQQPLVDSTAMSNRYGAGSELHSAFEKYFREFITMYFHWITPDGKFRNVLKEARGNKMTSLYRGIFEKIRFAFCKAYLVLQEFDRIVIRWFPPPQELSVASVALSPTLKMPFLDGGAVRMVSKLFWELFGIYEDYPVPTYPKSLLNDFFVHNFGVSSCNVSTFAILDGSLLWIADGCRIHANVQFSKLEENLNPFTTERFLTRHLSLSFKNIVPLRNLIPGEQLLILSRPSSLSFAEPPEKDDLYAFTRIDRSRLSNYSEFFFLEVIDGVQFEVFIHWCFLKFVPLLTLADGNCFYDSVYQGLNKQFLVARGFKRTEGDYETYTHLILDFKNFILQSLLASYKAIVANSRVFEEFFDDLVATYSTTKEQTFTGFLNAQTRHGIWGSDTLGLLIALFFGIHVVFVTAFDGSFSLSSVVLRDFVESKKSKRIYKEIYPVLQRKFHELFAGNCPFVFLLNCNSSNPYLIGHGFRKEFGAKAQSSIALNHFITLDPTIDYSSSSMSFLNHLLILGETLWNPYETGKSRWNDEVPSQKCIPESCEYYNEPPSS